MENTLVWPYNRKIKQLQPLPCVSQKVNNQAVPLHIWQIHRPIRKDALLPAVVASEHWFSD